MGCESCTNLFLLSAGKRMRLIHMLAVAVAVVADNVDVRGRFRR